MRVAIYRTIVLVFAVFAVLGFAVPFVTVPNGQKQQ